MENEKELQQLKNRFRDLADKSFSQNMFTFTGFLGLGEQDVLWQMERELSHAGYMLYGGAQETDRKVLRFGSVEELGYEVPFPNCVYPCGTPCGKVCGQAVPQGFPGGIDEPWD